MAGCKHRIEWHKQVNTPRFESHNHTADNVPIIQNSSSLHMGGTIMLKDLIILTANVDCLF